MARARSPAAAPRPPSDEPLLALGAELARLRRRAGGQWRKWRRLQDGANDVEAARAGESWSATIDAAMQVADRIAKTPAHGIEGLVVKFDAAWWFLVLDDSILDANAALAGSPTSVAPFAAWPARDSKGPLPRPVVPAEAAASRTPLY